MLISKSHGSTKTRIKQEGLDHESMAQ